MKFPDYRRAIFAKNPLIEVVCQVRYPRLLAIDAELPVDFQKRIQGQFPTLAHQRIQILGGGPADGGSAAPYSPAAGQVLNVYDFQAMDKKSRVSLTSEFVALTTSSYARWEEFSRDLKFVFEQHLACYGPSHFTRIGLRYKDVIDRQVLGLKEFEWAELIRPELLGLCSNPDMRASVSSLDVTSVLAMEVGNLNLRSYLAKNDETNVIGFMIDSDFWIEGSIEALYDNVHTILESFHKEAGAVFNWAITDRVREALEPQQI